MKDIKIRIGIVDDHQLMLEGIKLVLSTMPMAQIVFSCNSASLALKKMNRIEIDLLITDVSMPDINGWELAKTVKTKYPETKILVMSMFKSMQPVETIDGYLLKSEAKDQLKLAVEAIMLNGEKYFYDEKSTLPNKEEAFEYKKKILSDREKEIIQLIAKEYTTEQIAEKLFISKYTVETHRKNVFQKLHVNTVAGLIKKALYLGVID